MDRLNAGGEPRGFVGLGVLLTALALLAPTILLLGLGVFRANVESLKLLILLIKFLRINFLIIL